MMLSARRITPLALLVVLLAALWASGVAGSLDWGTLGRNHAALAELIQRHPILAPLLYAATYAAATALSLPEAAVLTVAGGLLFGTWLGGSMAVLGATAGAVVLFMAARSAFATTLTDRGGRRLARIRAELNRNGFSYLLAIRLIPAFPFWLVNLAAAMAGMRLPPFAAATLIGIIPGSLIYAWIGSGLGEVLAAGQRPNLMVVFSLQFLGPLAALAALALVPVAWRSWKGRRGKRRRG